MNEEDNWRFVYRGKQKCFANIALGSCSVAHVRDYGEVFVFVAGADFAVELNAHRITGCVQHLGAENYRVEVKAGLVWIPAAVIYAAKHLQNRHQIDAVGQGYSVLSIARKDVVVWANPVARANLGTLLSDCRHPEA